MISITNKDSLISIEKEISKNISDYEYWGDLNLTYDELEILGDKFREKVQSFADKVDLEYLYKTFPCSLTTFCVFLVRYKYNVNFWGLLSDELGVSFGAEWHNEIGSQIRKTFRKYGFDISEVKDEKLVNIAPIIYEACLPPDSSLDDLFYILKYDSHNVFDPEVIIDELIDMRSYRIRIPLLKFLERFKNDKAIDYILEVHDTIIANEQHSTHESRYQKNYLEWKEKEKEKSSISSRKTIDRQTKPYLYFDIGRKGLCFVLPRIVITNEWTEEAVWEIKGEDGFSCKKSCRVFGNDSIRYIESIIVPVSPSVSYKINLYDGEDLEDSSLLSWDINGVSLEKPLVFNSNGRLVNTVYLQRPYMIMVYNNHAKIKTSKDLSFEYHYYPTDHPNYSIISINSLNTDSKLTYKGKISEISYISKPHLELSLVGKHLLSLDKDSFNIELFSEIPQLNILYESGNDLEDIEVKINGKIIFIDHIKGDEITTVDLKKVIKSKDREYGLYSVRLYQYQKFIKQIEFAYVANVKSNYSNNLSWPSASKRKYNKTLNFNLPEYWEIDFDNCNTYFNNEKTIVEYSSNVGSIHGLLKYNHENSSMKFDFDLPVNPYEMKLFSKGDFEEVNVTDKLYKIDLPDFNNNDIWLELSCFGRFKTGNYHLNLISVNGIEQTESIKVYQTGSGNINLSVFADTLNTCPLPAEIVLENDNNDLAPIIYIDDYMMLKNNPRCKLGKDIDYVFIDADEEHIDINVSRFGKNNNTKTLLFSESKLSKTKLLRGYPYKDGLEEGIYIVTNSSKLESDIFDDDIFEDFENNIEFNFSNNIFYVPHFREPGLAINNSKIWLDTIMKYLCSNRIEDELIRTLRNKSVLDSKIQIVDFDKYDIEIIVALAYFLDTKISNKKKEIIRNIMHIISERFLNKGDRISIIKLLIDLNSSQSVFDICVDNYSLLLFYGDKKEVKTLSTEVSKYSAELSVLLLMSADLPIKDCLLKEKYRDMIGKDAIRYMLDVSKLKDDTEGVEEQRKFLLENSSKVRIRLDDEIVGNEKDIQSMFRFDRYNNPILDVNKKQDKGIYFAHIRYIDQYINWYKLNSDGNGIKQEVREECKKLLADTKESIIKAVDIIKSNPELSQMTRQYLEALRYRCENPDVSHFSTSTFFYVQGLAAYLTRIPTSFERYDKYRIIGIHFMSKAFEIAPRLSKRDLLMAGTYIYLKRKEKQLCR